MVLVDVCLGADADVDDGLRRDGVEDPVALHPHRSVEERASAHEDGVGALDDVGVERVNEPQGVLRQDLPERLGHQLVA